MRVSASLGLVALLASFVSCEQRNYDRCVPGNSDFQCLPGKFCKPLNPDLGDLNAVGICMDSECSVGAGPNGCPASKPICAVGRCTACTTNGQCAAVNPAQPYCGSSSGPLLGMCVECTMPANCDIKSAKPACDTAVGVCKPCTLHSQCSSLACVKDDTLNVASVPVDRRLTIGQCVPPERVSTVSVSCGASCTLQAALDNSSIDKPYVLVKDYASTAAMTINAKAGLPELHVITMAADISPAQLTVAPAATITYQGALGAIQVTAGASATIEGMVVFSSSTGVVCDSNKAGTATPTNITLLRSIIGLNDVGVRTRPMCKLTVDQSYIGRGTAISKINGGNYMAMDLDSTDFTIVNSVFANNVGKLPVGMTPGLFGGIRVTDSAGLKLPGRIVNTTFYRHSDVFSTGYNGLALACPSAITNLTLFNTLFLNPAPLGKPYVDPNCRTATTFDYIGTDETLPLAGAAGSHIIAATEADLVAPTNGDFSLKKSSTALATGGAQTVNGIAKPPLDVSGLARGAATVSIGAFEVTQ